MKKSSTAMQRFSVISLVMILLGCHGLKKTVDKTTKNAVTLIEQNESSVSKSQINENVERVASELSKQTAEVTQLSGSVTEKFDKKGRVTERTTSFSRRKKHHTKQKQKHETKTQEKQKVAQDSSKVAHIEVEEQTHQEKHEEVKRKRTPVWFWLGSGIILGLLYRFRNLILKKLIWMQKR